MAARRGRGDGSLYQRPDGLWAGSVDLGTGADGKRRRKVVTATEYATAVRKLRELRRSVEDGYTATSAPTLEAWLDRWLAEVVKVKPRTLVSYRGQSRHLVRHLGKRRLDKLTPAHVRELHRGLEAEGKAPSSVLLAHRVLGKALTDAVREGLVPRAVTSLVDAPRLPDGDQAVLTTTQATHLLRTAAAAGDPLTTRWAAALLLGARQGELLGLTWDRVDLEHGTADLAWQLQALPWEHGCEPACGGVRRCPARRLVVPRGFEHREVDAASPLAFTRPKSRAGRRVVPLPAPLVALLQRHRDDAGRVPGKHDLVWTSAAGKPIAPRADSVAWKVALERAGLPAVPLHAARHTTATLLLEAGVDGHVVQQVLGHSSILTSRGYQHVSLELARSGMDWLSGLLPDSPAR